MGKGGQRRLQIHQSVNQEEEMTDARPHCSQGSLALVCVCVCLSVLQ